MSTVVIGERTYTLRAVGELSERELVTLVDAGRGAKRVQRLARLGRRPPRTGKVSRLLDRSIAALLPDLEPHVLRELPFEERVALLDAWAGMHA